MSTQAKYFLSGLALFLYGSAVHLLLLRLLVHWGYQPPANRSLVDRPLVNAALAVLGGAWVAAFMLRLLRWTRAHEPASVFAVVCRAGLFGVAATLLTLETFYILACMFGTLVLNRKGPGQAGLIDGFILCMIDVQTYGTVLMVLSLPFAALYGAVAGAFLLWASKVFRWTG